MRGDLSFRKVELGVSQSSREDHRLGSRAIYYAPKGEGDFPFAKVSSVRISSLSSREPRWGRACDRRVVVLFLSLKYQSFLSEGA